MVGVPGVLVGEGRHQQMLLHPDLDLEHDQAAGKSTTRWPTPPSRVMPSSNPSPGGEDSGSEAHTREGKSERHRKPTAPSLPA